MSLEEVKLEKQPARTLETVRQEYSRVCAQAGQAQYQVHILERDISMLNEELEKLNQEATALLAKEKKEEKANA